MPEPESRRLDPASATPERVLALAGVVGLLAVGLISLLMITGAVGGDDEERPFAAPPIETPTPTPTPTPEPSPTPVPLTPEQRLARRAAAELVRTRGFEVVKLSDYEPRHTLRVLLGRQVSGARLAFFFVGDGYIGNDGAEPSAKLRIHKRTMTQVTLAYGIYAPGDEACCPTGGPVRVRFKWDGARLVPRDPVPPPEQRTPGRAQLR